MILAVILGLLILQNLVTYKTRKRADVFCITFPYRPKGTAKHPALDNQKENTPAYGRIYSLHLSNASLNEFGRYSETRMEFINTLFCSSAMSANPLSIRGLPMQR